MSKSRLLILIVLLVAAGAVGYWVWRERTESPFALGEIRAGHSYKSIDAALSESARTKRTCVETAAKWQICRGPADEPKGDMTFVVNEKGRVVIVDQHVTEASAAVRELNNSLTTLWTGEAPAVAVKRPAGPDATKWVSDDDNWSAMLVPRPDTRALGEIVLVMGPSGSGKTTLLSMLGGLLQPSGGEIWVDGVDIAQLSEHELPRFRAHRFGFIFQDFNLLAALSAEENVEVALNLAGSRGTNADARARRLLDDLGLRARLEFAADQLSGGEKQRVAVARAIANRPQLILADEPTANLDSQRGKETMRLLRRLANDEGATVLIISHDERLREVADRVLWLEDGQFKEMVALVRDPVCDMLLDPERAPERIEQDGLVIFFCSRGCREQYEHERASEVALASAAQIPR